MSDNKKVVARECRFAVYCPPERNSGDYSDLHTVKEILHYSDGTTKPNLRLIQDFKRPFWITNKSARNHQQKKEWEAIDKVSRYETTQTDLTMNIAKAIGEPWYRGDLRKLCRNPYIYGSDILSTAVIKRMYQDKFPETITAYSMAVFDIETNVLDESGGIIMATVSYKDRVVTVVKESFLAGRTDVRNRLQTLLMKYIGEHVEKRNINWEVELVNSEVEIIQHCFKRLHEWMPDFVAIWNINFDIPKVVAALERAGVDPKDVFSDPKVPPQYRHFRYKQGPSQKVTASGKITPIKPSAQWHTVFCPSSFYFIDAMCAYRHIRTGNAEEPSYGLDAILKKHKLGGKLSFEEADKYVKLEWHQFMQEHYPLEYVIYNVFDCVSMELLDETTSDLSYTLPLFSGCSDFENFKSQPRRLADNLHYFCLENGKVFGSTSDEMANELDKETLGLDGWIVTLPAHLVMDNGLKAILEDPNLCTNIRAHVGDLDVSASYPNGGSVFNISKETTHKELCAIRGVPESVQRIQGINLSAGATNAVEFACDLYGLPNFETLLKEFVKNDLPDVPQ